MKLLIVDDDEALLEGLAEGLADDHTSVTCARTVPEALEVLGRHPAGAFDLIVLDQRLPGPDGIELLHELREAGSHVPVIFITGDDTLEGKVQGLREGADDYIVKPFKLAELRARIDAVLRRRVDPPPVEYGELRLDLTRRRAWRSDQSLDLSPREFSLLLTLVKAKGELVSRERLLSDVWELEFDPGTNVLDVHVGRLRRKLDRLGSPLIENERGRGYRVLAPPSA